MVTADLWIFVFTIWLNVGDPTVDAYITNSNSDCANMQAQADDMFYTGKVLSTKENGDQITVVSTDTECIKVSQHLQL